MRMPQGSKRARQKAGKRSAKKGQTPPATQNPVAFDAAKLKQLYSAMLRCRMASERARLLAKQGKISGDVDADTGQEAAMVGALLDLLADDCVASGQRDLTAYFIRGTPLKTVFAQLHARPAGTNEFAPARSGRNAVPQAMIAPAFGLSAQLSLVTGVAWSLKRHGKPGVAVAFSVEDSASSAFWLDAVRFSAAHKLPIVHIVHSGASGGSVSARLGEPGEDSAANMQRLGLPKFIVDGNDVVAVYRVVQEAVRRARQGHGPALIECRPYRCNQPLEAESSHRSSPEPLAQSTDPLARLEADLRAKRLWSDKWKRKLEERFGKEIDKAVKFAERSPRKPADQTGPSAFATAS